LKVKYLLLLWFFLNLSLLPGGYVLASFRYEIVNCACKTNKEYYPLLAFPVLVVLSAFPVLWAFAAFGAFGVFGAFVTLFNFDDLADFDDLAELDVFIDLHDLNFDFSFPFLDNFPFDDLYRFFDSLQDGGEVGFGFGSSGSSAWSGKEGTSDWSGIEGTFLGEGIKGTLSGVGFSFGFLFGWRGVGAREDDRRTRVIWWCTPLVPLNVVVNVCACRWHITNG